MARPADPPPPPGDGKSGFFPLGVSLILGRWCTELFDMGDAWSVFKAAGFRELREEMKEGLGSETQATEIKMSDGQTFEASRLNPPSPQP